MKIKIGDITKIRTGKLDANAADENGQYPFFTCSKEPLKINTYSYDCECVLVAGNGDLNVKYYNGKFDAYQRTYIIEDDSDGLLFMPYLYFFMESYIDELRKQSIGGVIKYIKLKNLTDALIELPSIEVQRKIVNIISKAKEIVRRKENEFELLDELVKARFVEMFGDLRVNDKGWKYYKLDELTELITDGEHATPKRTTQGIYLLSARNVLNHQLSLEDVDYIDYDEFSRISRRIIPREGDVLISCSGSIGRCCVVPKNIKFQMVRSIALLRFKSNINPVFAEYMITSDYLQNQINKSKTASSQANLFQGKIKSLKGVVPPLELQNQFASFVQEIDKSRLLNICLKSLVESVLKIRIFSEYKKSS
ncbi:restriction endonuclease subunit S [Catenibacterium mitsuokai]|uniref:restriction endonuclease subunit S n=1 Tax=Catenibacterium mitsuokai TaxID=100886 RepID=UPI0022E2A15A|nr:restriction endonuclease subunit S [Catenibacterium mitsuokai]